MLSKMTPKILLLLRLIAAGILLQTLFFKFTGASESKFIFSTLGIEPWGRWFSGFAELVASILLLVPVTQLLGAGMALGVMLGALASHVLILGVVVQNDGGLFLQQHAVQEIRQGTQLIVDRLFPIPFIEDHIMYIAVQHELRGFASQVAPPQLVRPAG